MPILLGGGGGNEAMESLTTQSNVYLKDIQQSSIPLVDGVGFKVSINGAAPGPKVGDQRFTALELLGKKRVIPDEYSVCAPLFLGAEFPFIPATRDTSVFIQVSSTSIDDTDQVGGTGMRAILMIGYGENGTQISEVILMNGLAGSVSSVNKYRAMYLFTSYDTRDTSIMGGANHGDVYISPFGTTLTLGIPTRSLIMAGMGSGANGAVAGNLIQGDALGYCGYSYFPAGSEVYYSNFLFTLSEITNNPSKVQVGFITKDFDINAGDSVNDSGWRTFCSLYTDTETPSGFTQTAFPSTKVETTKDTITMMICRKIAGMGGNDIFISAYLSGMMAVKD